MMNRHFFVLLMVSGLTAFAGVPYDASAQNPAGALDGVTAGLAVRFDFNGNWNDVSGNAIHGSPVELWHGRDAFSYEKRGSAHFQSPSSKLLVPLNINPTRIPEMTFTGWIKPHAFPSPNYPRMTVFSNLDNRTGRALRFLKDPETGETGLTLFLGQEETEMLPVPLDNWTFVAVTFSESGQSATIYAGEEKKTFEGRSAAGRRELSLGHCSWDQRISFLGLMDDIRFYYRNLSEDELHRIRDARSPAREQFNRNHTAFLPKRPGTIVRENWTHDSPIIGTVEPEDTLVAERILRAVNTNQKAVEISPNRTFMNMIRRSALGFWITGVYPPYESVEVPLPNSDSGTGYVDLDDLIVIDLAQPAFLTWLRGQVHLYTRPSQLLTLGLLLLILLFVIFYPSIDTFLLRLGDSDHAPGVAWPVMLFLITGFIIGVMYPFTEPLILNYLETPLLWPAGHEFAVWYLTLMTVLMGLTFIISLVESFKRAGIIVGVIRYLLLMAVAAAAFLLVTFLLIETFLFSAVLVVLLILTPKLMDAASEWTRKEGQWFMVSG